MTKSKNYYFLTWKNPRKVASALAPNGTKLAQDLIPELDGIDKLPFELQLVKLSVGKNGLIENQDISTLETVWLDYQPNSLAWPLMSENLKSVILKNLTGQESINWITAKINGINECRNYYIPRFEKRLDVLDFELTTFVKETNHIIRPHFSIEKVSTFSMFNKPSSYDFWKITSGLYVNEELKNSIQKAKLTGLTFEKVRAS